MICGMERDAFQLGLSLTARSPAAAWYFIVIECHFFALQGEKMTLKELNIIASESPINNRTYAVTRV